ncbi:hypothetical protein [Variovorax sp. KK3]|uniref:hypothetical protein n=1 Tax=Variovorax sp. KK3 TaxID=1855728 RepID=UPI00097C72D7|nr:hypothetical protein [Variovorax sp. KK3]
MHEIWQPGEKHMEPLGQDEQELRLPLILTERKHFEVVRDLVHAGQAQAVMKLVADPYGGCLPVAGVVVSEITPEAWQTLQARLRE